MASLASPAKRADLDPLLSLVAGVVAVAATFALWRGDAPAPTGDAAPQVAEVSSMAAEVRRRPRGELAWQRVAVGAPLRAGDTVFVPPGGAARVRFLDGSRMELEGDTLVALDAPGEAGARGGGSGRLRLNRGEGTVHSGARGIQIDAAFGQAQLGAGTSARLSGAGEEGEVEVLAGEAELGDGTKLGPNESARTTRGKWTRADAWEVPLEAPAPGARTFYTGAAPPPVALRWRAPADKGARLRVWLGAGDQAPLVDEPARDGAAELRLPGPGGYLWRITDARGAPLSEGRRLHLVRDVPPVPVSPLQAEVIHGYLGRKVPLGWSQVPGVRAYQVEVSATLDFAAPALRREVEGMSLHLGDELEDGRYHWRVRTFAAAERGESPWSTPGAFRYLARPVPDAPELLDAQLELDP